MARLASIATVAVLAALFAIAAHGKSHPVRDAIDRALARGLAEGRGAVQDRIAAAKRAAEGIPTQHQRRCNTRPAGSLNLAADIIGEERCANGEYCDGGPNSCCQGGAFCCDNNNTCCQDTCCSNTTDYRAETCCPDPTNGGVCCIEENTFCCKPQPGLDHPSRCCPRWFVCCDVGRYGCCDPATMKPMEDVEADRYATTLKRAAAAKATMRGRHRVATQRVAGSNSTMLAAALFLEPTLWGGSNFEAAIVDAATGVVRQVKIGPGFHDAAGEITRLFMWDRVRRRFHLLQANFTDPALHKQITLYSVDDTGATTVTNVTGAHDEVTGFKYSPEHDTIVFATYKFRDTAAGTKNKIGYNFYKLDIDTGAATLLSASAFTTDDWAGWFHEVSPDLKRVWRLGYEHVVTSENFGIGETDISTSNATVKAWIAVPDPEESMRLKSIHYLNTDLSGGNLGAHFASLGASTNISDITDLSVYAWWTGAPSSATKLATFKNAHYTPYFGPVAEGLNVNRTVYAAGLVAASPLGRSYDVWTVASVDTLSGNATQVELSPTMLASTDSLSGFGVV